MASAVGSSAETKELRISYTDEAGETATQTIVLEGITTDAAIALYIDHLEAVTNAKITAKVVVSFPVTGIANTGKPSASSQSLLATILAMEFDKVSPLNDAKDISKQVLIPAYINSLRGTTKPLKPVTNNSNLNAMIAFLESNLDYVAADGNHYAGSWTYNTSSKFGTKPTVTDGL